MAGVNLSFSACGFMGIYQLGAASAFLTHGHKLVESLRACAGASAGALVAAVIITAPDRLEQCKEFTIKLASNVRKQKLGAMTPGYDFMCELRDGIDEILPTNAHLLACKRLHVSITNLKMGRNSMVSSFSSREDLIQVLLASSFVPVYAGMKAVELQGQNWIDGGFTDGLPILPVGRTITVSPFSGPQDVCPPYMGQRKLYFRLANMKIILCAENIRRLYEGLFPPSLPRMQALHQEGYTDALRFLKTEGWMRS
ncbi:patatin-like phospholipase domain-containing protein 4 [Trichomycterus rosablanca]|uniref:patatin-like phospholipase domain-containing protein 4 n=1 Tax=Trichomycterus rosablanca TaxID=2290929 RepID=UPI002F35DD51